MTIIYLDPYKDNLFARLKGDKRETYFKVVFDEAKFYKHELAYVLAGQFTSFLGVDRAYNPSQSIQPGLCELPLYGSEYEVRQKKPGTGSKDTKPEYETLKLQPSTMERLFYKHIEDNPEAYLNDGVALKGDITFYPDDTYASYSDDTARLEKIIANVNFESIEISGKYPNWIPPKPFTRNSYNGNKVSIQDKLVFLKQELSETVNQHSIRSDKTLPVAAYVHKILDENADNERFIVTYFDLVKALFS